MSELSKLQSECEQITALINETNEALRLPVSDFKGEFEKFMNSSVSRKLGREFAKAVSKGRIEEAILGGAVVGSAYLVAVGLDAVRNWIAYSKAKETLAGYYKELAVKHNLIIEEQKKILKQLSNSKNILMSEKIALQQKYDQLESICKKILEAEKNKSV
ncbi:MAG TPA: hypothetical protein PLK32_08835 [Defluviitoga tunisiensis]|nr:hypothetical protein [Defluviitoga tunisiensis]